MKVSKESKERRLVVLGRWEKKRSKGGPTQLWAYGIKGLARLFRCSEAVIRKRIRANLFDPSDIEDVFRYLTEKSEEEERRADRPDRSRLPTLDYIKKS